MERKQLAVAPAWLYVTLLTFALGFGILGYLAYRIYADQPPIPERFVGPDGATLFTREDILQGQHVFQTRGLMEHGSLFGHGAYLGPDFTADTLHRMEQFLRRIYGSRPDVDTRIRDDFKGDHFDGRQVHWSAAQVAAWSSWLHDGGDSGAQALLAPLAVRYIDDFQQAKRIAAAAAWLREKLAQDRCDEGGAAFEGDERRTIEDFLQAFGR